MRHRKIRVKEAGVEGLGGEEVEAMAAVVAEVVGGEVEVEDEVIDNILKIPRE